jgi:hypothetical protein
VIQRTAPMAIGGGGEEMPGSPVTNRTYQHQRVPSFGTTQGQAHVSEQNWISAGKSQETGA